MLIICGNYVSFQTTLWSNKDKYQQSFALHKSNYLLLLQIIFMSCPLLLFSSHNVYVKGFSFFCFCFGLLLLDISCQGMRQDLTRMGSGQIRMFRKDGAGANTHV